MSSWLVWLVAVCFNLLALAVTVFAFPSGFVEANPVMAGVFSYGFVAVFLFVGFFHFWFFTLKHFLVKRVGPLAGFAVANTALSVWALDLINDVVVVWGA